MKLRYRRLARYPLRRWRNLLVIAGLSFVTAALAAIQPLPLKVLADNALGDAPPPHYLRSSLSWLGLTPTRLTMVVFAAAAGLVLFVLASAAGSASSWTFTAASQRMKYDLAGDLFQKLQRRSLLVHSRGSLGDSLGRLSIDAGAVGDALPSLLSLGQTLLSLTAIWVTAWKLDAPLAALLISITVPLAVTLRSAGPRMKGYVLRARQVQSRIMSLVHQVLDGIPLVQSFSAETRNTAEFRRRAGAAIDAAQRGVMTRTIFMQTTGLVVGVWSALVLYVGSVRVLGGGISIGALLVFIAYLRRIQMSSVALSTSYGGVKVAAASAERVIQILEADEAVRDLAHARPFASRPAGHVRIEQVTFGYEADRPVLKEVSVEARPGEVVALVGPTGAGKSTLVSLILRFFDPWEGRVCIDGADVRDRTLESLRAQVSLVLQEPLLLPLSIADNIAYGRVEATREEIEAAAVAANADEFIRALPEGYDTVIGERGASLSVGERQRITIARALLKDAPILILDEPTSALDAQTEASLLQALDRLIEKRTTFIIAHRLSTVRRANRIVVLDHGRVVEIGRHRTLVAAGGLYQRLHTLQFAGTRLKATVRS